MAAELETEMGVVSNLIKDGGGIFDVIVDGELVFSKHELDRFPVEGEVGLLIKNMQSNA